MRNLPLYEEWVIEQIYTGKEIVKKNQGLSRSEDGSSFISDSDKFELITIPIGEVNNKGEYSWYKRNNMDEDLGLINRMIEKIKSGIKIHPIVLDKDMKILDGNHRFVAYRKLKWPTIQVYKQIS